MTGGVLLTAAFALLCIKRQGALARGLGGAAIVALCLAATGDGEDAAGPEVLAAAAALVAALAFATSAAPATFAVLVVAAAIASATVATSPLPVQGAVWLAAATAALIGAAFTSRAPRGVLIGGGSGLLAAALGICLIGVEPAGRAIGGALALAGLATLAGLAPLHRWSPSTPPPTALLMVAVHACALIGLRATAGPGAPLLAFGVASVAIGAADVWFARTAGRKIAAACAMQRGLAAVAFGLGDPVADGIGLMHVLIVSASQASAIIGPEKPLARAAMAGLPPSGVFMGVVGIVSVMARSHPWLAAIAATSALAGGAGLLRDFDGPLSRPVRKDAPALALMACAAVLGFVPPATLFGR